MSIGARVRRLFGSRERQIAEAYRSIYVDLDDFARQLPGASPDAVRILEVGCGEGALTQRLLDLYPQARVTAIDIIPGIGRLFGGDQSRVDFRQAPVEEIATAEPGAFDLVVMCDVLHHVPQEQHVAFLGEIYRTIRVGGCFAVKDWARSATPIHWLCAASDRYLTGDDVKFATPEELKNLLAKVFGADKIRRGSFIRPWSNNICFLARA